MCAVKESQPIILRIDAGRCQSELSYEEFERVLALYGRAESKGTTIESCVQARGGQDAGGSLCNEEKLGFLWIDIQSPTIEVLQTVSRCLRVHQLTIKDCMSNAQANQKIEGFGTYRFLSLSELQYVAGTSALDRSNIHIICVLNSPCIVTIHDRPMRCLSFACAVVNGVEEFGCSRAGEVKRWPTKRHGGSGFVRRLDEVTRAMNKYKKMGCAQMERWSPEWITCLIIEGIVSSMMRIADENALRIETLEDTVFTYQACERSVFLYKILKARRILTCLKMELYGNACIISQIIGQDAWVQRVCEPSTEPSLGFAWGSSEHKHVCFCLRHTLNQILHSIDDFSVSTHVLANLALAYYTFISVNVRAISVHQSHFIKIIVAISAITIPATVTPTLWGMNVNVYLDQIDGIFGFYLITGTLLASIIICMLFFKVINYI